MATIFLNEKINGTGKVWSAKNGATRRELVLIINDKDFPDGLEGKSFDNCKVGWLDKGNHSFIFINKTPKKNMNNVGIFLNGGYGYTVHTDTEIFTNSSIGGYGNSESRFGIYKLGTIIEEHTYKYRRPSTFWYLGRGGWECLGTQADIMANLSSNYCKKVADTLGWLVCENCIE